MFCWGGGPVPLQAQTVNLFASNVPMPVFFDVFTFFTPFFSHCLGTKRVILQDPSGPVPSNCWLALRYFAPHWCPDRTVASMGKQTASQWYDPLRIESLMRDYLPFLKKRAFSKPFWGEGAGVMVQSMAVISALNMTWNKNEVTTGMLLHFCWFSHRFFGKSRTL